MRPMIVSDVTDLPDPDSPTTPRVSPRSRVYETPSTALTTPSWVWKYILRSSTSRRCEPSGTGWSLSSTQLSFFLRAIMRPSS